MGESAVFYTYPEYVPLPCKALGLSSFWPEEWLRGEAQLNPSSREPVVPANLGTGTLTLAGSEETAAAQLEQTLNPTVYHRASISFFTLFITVY